MDSDGRDGGNKDKGGEIENTRETEVLEARGTSDSRGGERSVYPRSWSNFRPTISILL